MKQNGVALVTGLVLLTAVSLLALSAANSMTLHQRQAANFSDKTHALEQAHGAEAWARGWLFSREDIERESGCVFGCTLPAAIRPPGEIPDKPQFESLAWWRLNGHEAGIHPESGADLASRTDGLDPAYWIMEERHVEPLETENVAGIAYYRICARGRGTHPRSVAVTETIVARPWQGDYDASACPPGTDQRTFCRQFSREVPCGVVAWRRLR